MSRITFEITVDAPDAGDMTDTEEEDNIASCIMDALGFPAGVIVTAKVLSRSVTDTKRPGAE